MTNADLIVTRSLIGQAEDLAKEHELFKQQYVIAGRAALYGLLQKIMKLSEAFDASADKEDLIKLMRAQLLNDYGIKTQDNSSDASVLVRFVTRADRKAAHVYARAIESAKANGIKSTDFVNYVKEKGGIERIRCNGVDPAAAALTKKNELEARQNMWEFLRLRSELPFATFRLGMGKLPVERAECYLQYLVAVRRGDEYRIVSALDIDDEQELKLLAPLQQVVAERLAIDKEALEKMRRAVNSKKKVFENNQEIAEGEVK